MKNKFTMQYKIDSLNDCVNYYIKKNIGVHNCTIDNTRKKTKRIIDTQGEVMAWCSILSNTVVICPKNSYCETLPYKQYAII